MSYYPMNTISVERLEPYEMVSTNFSEMFQPPPSKLEYTKIQIPYHRLGGGGGGGGLHRTARPFHCVRLRGLPFAVNEDDIHEFLGVQPVDILIIRRNGRATGDAMVVFADQHGEAVAYSRNKNYLGRRYIEVMYAGKLDYYNAVADCMSETGRSFNSYKSVRSHYSEQGRAPRRSYHALTKKYSVDDTSVKLEPFESAPVLRLRGLPFSATREDIADWFNSDSSLVLKSPVTADNVAIVLEYGRPSGFCFVQFSEVEDARASMSKDRDRMGNRYIEIFQSSMEELNRYSDITLWQDFYEWEMSDN